MDKTEATGVKNWYIQRAAKLRTRHRAGCLVICLSIADRVLVFSGPGTEKIEFWCSWERKY